VNITRTILLLVCALVVSGCITRYQPRYYQPRIIGGKTPMECKTRVTNRGENVRCVGKETLSKSNAIRAAQAARNRNRAARQQDRYDSRYSNDRYFLGGIVRVRPTGRTRRWCDIYYCTPGKFHKKLYH